MMQLRQINFGDVDAKNEILKQSRSGENGFFESFSMPKRVNIDDFLNGVKYFVLGLKGTGKTALLRYIHDITLQRNFCSEFVLFKSNISEEDKRKLSSSAGFKIITTSDAPEFVQDFKEAWKWMIYTRIAEILKRSGLTSEQAVSFYKITGVYTQGALSTFGALFSKFKAGNIKLSADIFGVATELGIEIDNKSSDPSASISDINRLCSTLLNGIKLEIPVYLIFDELELFHQTTEQFDRDRRIIRDLVYAISQINADSAENNRKVYLISSLRTEVLHSILELGHEIGRDVDDFGVRLDWSEGKDSPDHPLMKLIARKISASTGIIDEDVWDAFFPTKINNQIFYKFILNSSYYRPRDIVRLLRVARDHKDDSEKFTTEHFDRTSTEYSKQTWLEVTEELLAVYSSVEIDSLQRFFLGFQTHFMKEDIQTRVKQKYINDKSIGELFGKHSVPKILSDLYRIGVLGNDFFAYNGRGGKERRHRWIFRGNATLNDAERMSIHKSLWKHLSLIAR